MKALRRKDTGEWLSMVTPSGALFNGNAPKEVGEKMNTVQEVEDTENIFRHENCRLTLTDYELVEIEIVVKRVIDKNL